MRASGRRSRSASPSTWAAGARAWALRSTATLLDWLADAPVHVVLAGIVLPNDASVALHRKLGFTEVGTFHEYALKNGQYLSSLWMERRL